MSAPPASSITAFVTLTLGRSANAIELSVPPAPPVHAAGDLKARSFDFLADLLAPHSALYSSALCSSALHSSAELFAAFAGHIPISACKATLEAESVCCVIRSSIFHVAFGFRDHLGQPISFVITDNATNKCPPLVTCFAFRSTICPNAVDACLSIPSHSFEFWLALPQTMLGTTAPPVLAATETAHKQLDFAAPNKSPPPVLPLLLTNLSMPRTLPPWTPLARLLLLGAASSTNIMSDYAPIALLSFPLPRSKTLSFVPLLLLLLLLLPLPFLSSLLSLPK
jgi:hypothetical protein